MIHSKHIIVAATMLVGLSAFAAETTGPKVEFTGMLDADAVGTYDSDAQKMNYQANHEADLVANAKFSEKAVISLGLTSYTTSPTPAGGTPANDPSHWAPMYFDGIWANYEFDNGLKILGGDFAVSEGAFSYYAYKRTRVFASVMPENFFRGVGIDLKGVSVYAGADDASTATEVYAAYAFESGNFTARPFAFYSNDGTDVINLKAGLTAGATLGDHSFKATYGLVKDNDLDPTHTMKVEGTLGFGKISVAGSAYYSIISDSKPSYVATLVAADPTDPTSIGVYLEEGFFYVEPDYAFSDVLAAGPAFEYHLGQKGARDSWSGIYPNLYVNPAAGMQFVFWGGPTIPMDDTNADVTFAIGSEFIASF
jgi:hypothetical protein